MAKPDSVFVYIGTYPSEAAARDDYAVVKDLHAAGAVGTYDAAVVTKDNAGKVHVNKDEMATRHWAWGGAVVGIMFPPSIIAAGQAVLVIVGKSKLQQVADKAIEFRIRDEMSCLLLAQRSAQHAR